MKRIIEELYKALKKRYQRQELKWPGEQTFKEMCEGFKHDIGFVYFASSNKISETLVTPDKDFKPFRKGCFYNSIAYVLSHTELNLAFGFVTTKRDLEKFNSESELYPNLSRVVHAFCVDNNGNIIDPTLGNDLEGDDVYYYKIVDKDLWNSFNHKPNDTNFDAKDFHRYVYDTINSYQDKSIDWLLGLIKENKASLVNKILKEALRK